ncbi:expansin EXLX1 family cellulose-binding protein [Kineosporia sp. NBRC 101731]|uniref:expansin EXLX1 family cellulose-binding protein n=1 Tax=Kineosporia sp. NBRC 101731 TaxID=3032199 RepID=UPI0024A4E756|nr:expansin EXLX1 family cellulose-binding protein [Kineosporia sp. NBRC 101731]GLY32271.1 hypothetical protein Kisp02_56360 [Kineosporia sp. NBRC 101731]
MSRKKLSARVAAALTVLVAVGGGVYFAQSSSAVTPVSSSASDVTTSAAKDRVTLGTTYKGIATYYDADGTGACSFARSSTLMVAALNTADYQGSLMCGAYVKVTAANGKSITVKIVDLCPGSCKSRQLDLSKQAFDKLAPGKGQINVTWKLLSPKLTSPVRYVYKDGSTQWWCGVQVRNHRNPIRTIEFKTASGWFKLTRRDYNYFESSTGKGCGNTIRITDVNGNRLIDKGIKISTSVQKGAKQLPAA